MTAFRDSVHAHITETVERIREAMGLADWTLSINTGPMPDDTAATSSDPEYKQALIEFDPDKLKTGDDVEEFVVHEAVHIQQAWVEKTADDLADAYADTFPETHRESVRRYAKEQVRRGTEASATRLGHAFLRTFRRLWLAEAEIKTLRVELKALRKTAVPPEK
jgi:hypothetical protein